MGFFGNTSPFDSDVEKVTDEKKTSEDWTMIMNFCDKVGESEQNAKDSLRSIMKRLNHEDPHVQLLAITLLDACVNNCGKNFRLIVASREFTQEFRKLLSKVQEPKVNDKLKLLLKKWADEDFRNDDQLILIPTLYKELVKEGISFPKPETERPKGVKKEEIEELNDLSKAIELSLLETTSPQKSSGSTSNSLYPSTKLQLPTTQECRKVRALYDFEAAEDNELTFKAGEIIFVLDDSDPNWWKGHNQNGEGLFPSNFVSSETAVEPEPTKPESSKQKVSFDETVKVVKLPAPVEINEEKIDRLLHILHEADPCNEKSDSEEMLSLEEEVNAMGPLIDAELEKVDRKHAQLTQLSQELVDALNHYHMLMREPIFPPVSKPMDGPMPPYFNGMLQMPPSGQFMSLPHPQHPHPHPHPPHPHSHPHPHPHPHPPPHLHPPHAHPHPNFPHMPGPPQGPQSLPPQQYNNPFPPQSMPSYIGGYQPQHLNYASSQHVPSQQPMSPNSSLPLQMAPPVSAPYSTVINQPVSKLKPEFNQQ